MTFLAWLIFLGAALLEVSGDAFMRRGLRGGGMLLLLAGTLLLGSYGLIINLVKWDFSKLLGVYISIFAVVSILAGRFHFNEVIPPSTWLGLSLVVLGGLVIQFGPR